MKRIHTIRYSLLLSVNKNALFLAAWFEQFGTWVAAVGVDWTKLPWAFIGATVAMLKGKKDAAGQPIHKPFWEWVSIALGGTMIGLSAWKDVVKFTTLSPEFSTVIAGLIGWLAADYVIKFARTQIEKSDPTLPKL